MLIPLTRTTLETLIPRVATGAQYVYYWGKLSDFLRRLLISVVGVVVVLLILGLLLTDESGFGIVRFFLGIFTGLYWLWGPILWASIRNNQFRKYTYSGFWRGEVLDVYVTEELIGKEETVNNRGDLVIVENRERCLSLEVGDESGFSTRLQVPLKRYHQAIAVGDTAEMLVLSSRGDLGRINNTSDIYIVDHNIWVSDYPYLQREAFIEVSRQLRGRDTMRSRDDRADRGDRSMRGESRRTRRPAETGDRRNVRSTPPDRPSARLQDRPQDRERSRRRPSNRRRPANDWE